MSEHRWWHERGQQLRADRIHLSRVRPLTGERQRPGLGKRSENAARRRRARGFAELVDAFCLLVRRACLGPIEQRPTTWLGEPPSLVVARAFDADEFETTTKAEAARSPDVVLEPTRADSHSRAAWQRPGRYRETNTDGRRLAGDALLDLYRWDERDNVITCADVDAAPWQLPPTRDLATGSTPREGQATPSSRIAEFRSDPATWIVVGLGAPTYSWRDPRLSVAATAAGAGRPAVPDRGAFDLPAWKHG